MKTKLLSIVICCLVIACAHPQKDNRQELSLAGMVDYGIKTNKPVLVYLKASNSKSCKAFEEGVLSSPRVQKAISNHYLFKNIDILTDKTLNQILYSYTCSVFFVIENGEIVSGFFQTNDDKALLHQLKHYQDFPLEQIIPHVSKIQGAPKEVAHAVNGMLAFHLRQGKDNLTTEDIERLRENIERHPYFYNQYTLATVLHESDTTTADSLYSHLWENRTALDNILYKPQIQTCFEHKYKLPHHAKSHIRFEHTTMDLGEIKLREERKFSYPFRNDSSVPLLIYSVQSTCGCTRIDWNHRPILPGDCDSIQIVFTGKTIGAFHKTVTVKTNGTPPKAELSIEGKGIPENK